VEANRQSDATPERKFPRVDRMFVVIGGTRNAKVAQLKSIETSIFRNQRLISGKEIAS
jgi:hypothetical protein